MVHKVGAVSMSLSKDFNRLNHELLINKLKCYGIDQNAVEFFRGYLTNRYQCYKTNNTLGHLGKNIAIVPQGSILGSLSLNTFLNDIFFSLKEASLGNYLHNSNL